MIKKKYFAIFDTETTNDRHVADFAMVIVNRKGEIQMQGAFLIEEFYAHEELFFDNNNQVWNKASQKRRHAVYDTMLADGRRRLVSLRALNKWLDRVSIKFDMPDLVAYNKTFDMGVCANSDIVLSGFNEGFCLWMEAQRIFGKSRFYAEHCLLNKQMSDKLNFKTNAQVMFNYLHDAKDIEPHTALEDVLDFELPIFNKVIRAKKGIKGESYNWRNYQAIKRLKVA